MKNLTQASKHIEAAMDLLSEAEVDANRTERLLERADKKLMVKMYVNLSEDRREEIKEWMKEES